MKAKRFVCLLAAGLLLLWAVVGLAAEKEAPALRQWSKKELQDAREEMEHYAEAGDYRLPDAHELQMEDALALAEAAVRESHGVTDEEMAGFLPEAYFVLLDEENNWEIESGYTGYAWLIAFDLPPLPDGTYVDWDGRLSIYVHPETGEIIQVVMGSLG